jgi:hypothetical protein
MPNNNVSNDVIYLIRSKKYKNVIPLINIHPMYKDHIAIKLKQLFNSDVALFAHIDESFIYDIFMILDISFDEKEFLKVLMHACLLESDSAFFQLVQKYPSRIVNHQHILSIACKGGHMSIVQWLAAEADRIGMPIQMNKRFPYGNKNLRLNYFEIACASGKLDVVKWCIESENKYGKINIHFGKEMPFFLACIKDHSDVAKYLIWLGENTDRGRIDIHARDIFFRCVLNANFRTAEWLMDIGFESYGTCDLPKAKFEVCQRISEGYNFEKMRTIYQWIRRLPPKYSYENDCDSYDDVYKSSSEETMSDVSVEEESDIFNI